MDLFLLAEVITALLESGLVSDLEGDCLSFR